MTLLSNSSQFLLRGLSKALLTALPSVLLAACGGDSVTLISPETTNQPENNAGAAGTSGSEASTSNEPVYVVFSTIDTPDGRSSYYATTSSIDGDIDVDVTQGIEFPGHASLMAPAQGGYLLSASDDAPVLTRYGLSDDGKLEQGKTLSFASLGLTYGCARARVLFFTEEKAYCLDEEQLRVIPFNPKTMELVGEPQPVNDFSCSDSTRTRFGFAVQREDGFFFTKSCRGTPSNGAALVHLDTRTDKVTVTRDDRCMGMDVGFLDDSGDAYWFSDLQAAAWWSMQDAEGPHDCSLRLKAGETTFDKDWQLDLTTRTGGVSAVPSVPINGSKIWMKVFEEAAMPEPVPVEELDWGWSVWRWALLDLAGGDPVGRDESAALVNIDGLPIQVGDRFFSPANNEDYTETTLLEVTEDGFQERMVVQGELRQIVRLR